MWDYQKSRKDPGRQQCRAGKDGRLCALAAATLLLAQLSVTSAFAAAAYVSGDGVNFRREGSLESEIITSLSLGTAVECLQQGEEWSQVRYGDETGYLASRYLSEKQPEIAVRAESVINGLSGAAAENLYASRETVSFDSSWPYAANSKINSGQALRYRTSAARRGITVCVNAGHGTSGGGKVKTLCHPDGSPKVTGGSTAAGATTATAVSAGMEFADGTAESVVTLKLAGKLRDLLLADGYDVLMIREGSDIQLDNIARTVLANQLADCHIAIHWDSTESDKGAFFMSVPGTVSYRSMEPVASHWQQHQALGESLIAGLSEAGVKIFSSGQLEMDLTQTSYSTVPSVDIELGDKRSDTSDAALNRLAAGLMAGVDKFFQ